MNEDLAEPEANWLTAYQAWKRASNARMHKAWKARVDQVLRLHIGLIDEELCELTASFLVWEDWLINGKPELDNRHVLLIAKAVGWGGSRGRETGN